MAKCRDRASWVREHTKSKQRITDLVSRHACRPELDVEGEHKESETEAEPARDLHALVAKCRKASKWPWSRTIGLWRWSGSGPQPQACASRSRTHTNRSSATRRFPIPASPWICLRPSRHTANFGVRLRRDDLNTVFARAVHLRIWSVLRSRSTLRRDRRGA